MSYRTKTFVVSRDYIGQQKWGVLFSNMVTVIAEVALLEDL